MIKFIKVLDVKDPERDPLENAGIDFALVLSGEATRDDLAKEERQPTVVLEHLGEAEKDFL